MGIQFARQKGQLDTAATPPELLAQIKRLPAGEPFVLAANGRVIVSVLGAPQVSRSTATRPSHRGRGDPPPGRVGHRQEAGRAGPRLREDRVSAGLRPRRCQGRRGEEVSFARDDRKRGVPRGAPLFRSAARTGGDARAGRCAAPRPGSAATSGADCPSSRCAHSRCRRCTSSGARVCSPTTNSIAAPTHRPMPVAPGCAAMRAASSSCCGEPTDRNRKRAPVPAANCAAASSAAALRRSPMGGA